MFNFFRFFKGKNKSNIPSLRNLEYGLDKTSSSFNNALSELFSTGKKIDESILEELETILLTSDLGTTTTDKIINDLTSIVAKKTLNNKEELLSILKAQLHEIIQPVEQELNVNISNTPYVILVVGINGAGKTTTIGKLSKKFITEGKSVMLGAGDTFRAAAVEQLQTWGKRNAVTVISQQTGADTSAVIFDTIQSAQAKDIDVVIADTAGRLHTQDNLMQELKKIKRVIKKISLTAPHEVLLVLDSGIGQNAMQQIKIFNDAIGVTGIVMTKLDGTSKGGIIFSIANAYKIPIRFIGVGEGMDDLKIFNAQQFIESLFLTKQN